MNLTQHQGSLDRPKVRGCQLELTHDTGNAFGVSKRSNTHVSGYVTHNEGRVTSQIVVTMEFLLVNQQIGLNKPLQLHNVDIPLFEGQRVTMIYAARTGRTVAWCARLVNHDSRCYYRAASTREISSNLGVTRSVAHLFGFGCLGAVVSFSSLFCLAIGWILIAGEGVIGSGLYLMAFLLPMFGTIAYWCYHGLLGNPSKESEVDQALNQHAEYILTAGG